MSRTQIEKSASPRSADIATNATDPSRAVARPRVDVFENDASYVIVADMPGVATDALDVRFEGGELRIQGARRPHARGTALHEETRSLDFARVFSMPEGIDGDAVEASLAQGVLTVRLPKSASKRPRKIEVRAG